MPPKATQSHSRRSQGLAARHGFEPRLTESESVVLPLDDRARQNLEDTTPHHFDFNLIGPRAGSLVPFFCVSRSLEAFGGKPLNWRQSSKPSGTVSSMIQP